MPNLDRSNIRINSGDELGISLPPGCKCTPNVVNGKKEGIADVFTSDDILYATLSYHLDQLDGICEFYENGLSKEKITYKKGVAEGWGCVMEKGQEKWFFYSGGKKKSELTKNGDGYWIENEIGSGRMLSVCKYNDNHEKQGIGYVYKGNELAEEVEFSNSEVVKTFKKFQGNEMEEVNENGQVVYKGRYLNDMNQRYPRDGDGKEFEEGNVVYIGKWKRNMKDGEGTSYRNHRALYVGHWSENKPDGEGKLYDEKGKVLHEGKWKKGKLMTKKGVIHYDVGYTGGGVKKFTTQSKKKILQLKKKMNTKTGKRVTGLLLALVIALIGVCVIYGMFVWLITHTVRDQEDLLKLSKNARRLRIPANSCNGEELKEFRLSGYEKLERIIVGSNSVVNAKTVVIDSLDSLTLLEFGMNSFTQHKNGYGKDSSRSFTLTNCYALKRVVFDRFAFSDFSEFVMESE